MHRVEFLTPKAEEVRDLKFEQVGQRLRFLVPEFLVYGVVRIEFSKSKCPETMPVNSWVRLRHATEHRRTTIIEVETTEGNEDNEGGIRSK